MRLLIIALLISNTLFAQKVSFGDMFSLIDKRKDSSALILSLKKSGFSQVSYRYGNTVLDGKANRMILYRKDGVIDVIEYWTDSEAEYRLWNDKLKEFTFTGAEGNWTSYISDKYQVIVTLDKSYCLAVTFKH